VRRLQQRFGGGRGDQHGAAQLAPLAPLAQLRQTRNLHAALRCPTITQEKMRNYKW
jgi:hypothetical protein